MKPSDLSCWKCGASLVDVLLPFSRLSKCKQCNADLHVCRMCRFYDPAVNNSCREPVAEKVADKQHKNFCGYFQPSDKAFISQDGSKAEESVKNLNALFDLDPGDGQGKKQSEEDENRRRLEDLFNLDKKS